MRWGLESGASAVVVGQGPIGAAVALYTKEVGAELVVVDVRTECLERSRSILGMLVLEMGTPLPGAFGGELPRVVFSFAGSPEPLHASFVCPGPGGRRVFLGDFLGDVKLSGAEFHRRELTLLTSRRGTSQESCHFLETMESGAVRAEDMITHRFTFGKTPRRFPDLDGMPRLLKAMISIP